MDYDNRQLSENSPSYRPSMFMRLYEFLAASEKILQHNRLPVIALKKCQEILEKHCADSGTELSKVSTKPITSEMDAQYNREEIRKPIKPLRPVPKSMVFSRDKLQRALQEQSRGPYPSDKKRKAFIEDSVRTPGMSPLPKSAAIRQMQLKRPRESQT